MHLVYFLQKKNDLKISPKQSCFFRFSFCLNNSEEINDMSKANPPSRWLNTQKPKQMTQPSSSYCVKLRRTKDNEVFNKS